MGSDLFTFEQFAGSGRGLIARPVLPGNIIALLSHIAAVDYAVINITDSLSPITGSLTPADVMYQTPQVWERDPAGFTFSWGVPGTLWPLADKDYRNVVTFTCINPFPQAPLLAGKSFILAWRAMTKSPLTP